MTCYNVEQTMFIDLNHHLKFLDYSAKVKVGSSTVT